ncbi:hypothetical protein PanWU01x14_281770 [Parasponia andersonii]|uniref:Uncharacterized protein n=1 Tax=Parasponia andersonii TaxID=3476 RepID=A0A2P5B0U5_PARAD|nr:hypothetical protein PanWU01x14_281770 [Parasponia andersonii]
MLIPSSQRFHLFHTCFLLFHSLSPSLTLTLLLSLSLSLSLSHSPLPSFSQARRRRLCSHPAPPHADSSARCQTPFAGLRSQV